MTQPVLVDQWAKPMNRSHCLLGWGLLRLGLKPRSGREFFSMTGLAGMLRE